MAADNPNWLDGLLSGIQFIWNSGVQLVQRNTLNFLAPLTATDNPVTGATDISIAGGGGGATVVRVTATGNVTLSGVQVVDGVTPSDGDLILCPYQTSNPTNGPYVYNSAGAWSRAPGFNTAAELSLGVEFTSKQGTLSGVIFTIITAPTTLGVDPIVFGSSSLGQTLPAAPAGSGGVTKWYLLQILSTGDASWVQPTSDMIGAAFTVTLSGGSGGVFESGATWTLTGLTATPACNAAGVTAATLAEIINSVTGTTVNELGNANPLTGAQLPHTSYTRTTAGDIVDLQLTMTDNGFTKQSGLGSVRGQWIDPWYEFSDTANGPTGMVLATNTAQLTGGGTSAVGTKHVASFPIGTTFTCPSTGTPYYKLIATPTQGSAMTFADTNNTNFPMARIVTNTSYSNQYSVAHGFDIYVSNLINPPTAVTVHRAT